MLQIEPETFFHLSFLGSALLSIIVGPERTAYKINSNCLTAQQLYFQKCTHFPAVPVGETLGNEFSHGQPLKPGFSLGRAQRTSFESLSLGTHLHFLWEHCCGFLSLHTLQGFTFCLLVSL